MLGAILLFAALGSSVDPIRDRQPSLVLEATVLLGSVHPGKGDDFNPVNPGLLLTAGARCERVVPYVVAGAYLDSYKEISTVAGAGIQFGGHGFGMDVALVHCTGSGLSDYPVVPMPSVYFRHERFGGRILYTPAAIAFGVSYMIR